MERNIYRRERKIKKARKEGRQVYMLIPTLRGCPFMDWEMLVEL
jgi:hypothetical protein